MDDRCSATTGTDGAALMVPWGLRRVVVPCGDRMQCRFSVGVSVDAKDVGDGINDAMPVDARTMTEADTALHISDWKSGVLDCGGRRDAAAFRRREMRALASERRAPKVSAITGANDHPCSRHIVL